MVPSETKEKAGQISSPGLDAGELILPVGVQDDRLNIRTGSCLGSSALNQIEESLKKHEDSSSGVPKDTRTREKLASDVFGAKEDLSSVDAFHLEGGMEITREVPDNGDKQLGLRKPESEVKSEKKKIFSVVLAIAGTKYLNFIVFSCIAYRLILVG